MLRLTTIRVNTLPPSQYIRSSELDLVQLWLWLIHLYDCEYEVGGESTSRRLIDARQLEIGPSNARPVAEAAVRRPGEIQPRPRTPNFVDEMLNYSCQNNHPRLGYAVSFYLRTLLRHCVRLAVQKPLFEKHGEGRASLSPLSKTSKWALPLHISLTDDDDESATSAVLGCIRFFQQQYHCSD